MTFKDLTPHKRDRVLSIIGIDPSKTPENQGVSQIEVSLSRYETNKVLSMILEDYKRYRIPYIGNAIVQEERAKLIIQTFVYKWLTIWSSE